MRIVLLCSLLCACAGRSTLPASAAALSAEEDKDGDGIANDLDKCPDVAEDRDGFQDDDGCPEPDNDNDGLLDADDKCPNQPGPADNGGCPKR